MARPMNKLHQEDVRKRFYVYELFSSCGVQYVGKGSGARLSVQMRKFGLDGRIVQRFADERKAYAFEKAHIQAEKPPMNKCGGGNGSWTKAAERAPRWVRLIDTIGTRVYAARILMRYAYLLDPSKVDKIRLIANG